MEVGTSGVTATQKESFENSTSMHPLITVQYIRISSIRGPGPHIRDEWIPGEYSSNYVLSFFKPTFPVQTQL